MEKPKDYVYHGSPREFEGETVKPKRNIRSRINELEEVENIFDDISFHATPHKWIALAYTYDGSAPYEIEGKMVYHNMGVSLYEEERVVTIYGFGSLEESLDKLYGKGGFIYHFDKDNFFYTEGLGPLEVITNQEITPDVIERIEDPVAEMKKLGITFEFVDLAKSENEKFRNYARKHE